MILELHDSDAGLLGISVSALQRNVLEWLFRKTAAVYRVYNAAVMLNGMIQNVTKASQPYYAYTRTAVRIATTKRRCISHKS